MLVGAGGAVVSALTHGAISRTAAVVSPGLMVMAIILFMGAVSGAHLNPAVTLAFTLRRDFPWRRVPGYVLAQLAGAVLACLFLWALYGKKVEAEMGIALVVADGYHRICASYHLNEDADIPCRLADPA